MENTPIPICKTTRWIGGLGLADCVEVNFFLFPSIRLSSHGVCARSIPVVSTVDCECIRCKMQKTISAIYRTNSRMSEEGERKISEFEFENLWKCIFPRCECWFALCGAHFCHVSLQSRMYYRLSVKLLKQRSITFS